MAVNFMENFQIYGTDVNRHNRLLDGLWAEINRGDLQPDPDPTAGGNQVLRKFAGGTGGDHRRVIPVARTTVGVAGRFWYTFLPVNPAQISRPVPVYIRDQNNVTHLSVSIDPSGILHVYRHDNGGPVDIGNSGTPVILTNAWQHMEVKAFLDVAVGTVEVRIEGVPVIVIPATRTTSNVGGAIASCQQYACGSGWDGPTMYVKDLIFWDSTGAFNNNFMGSCQVYKIAPDADVALNWTPNPADGIGFDKINEVTPDDDTRYISAPFPLPAAYKCSLTDLPVTVTSVRAVMPIHRSRKTDGGDGNVQTGLISAASTGLGANRPITTAYTYWADVFDADPNGGIAWTRLAVNAMQLQLNRTV